MTVVYAASDRGEEAGAIRVLIAIAPTMYGQALAYTLQKSRPTAEVARVEPGGVDRQLDGFVPQLVVCNGTNDELKALVPSWVVLTYEARGIEATVFLGGRRSTIEDVGMEDLLAVMDEAERLSAAT